MMCKHENRFLMICTEVQNIAHTNADGYHIHSCEITHDPVKKLGVYVCANCEELIPVLLLQEQLAATNARLEVEKELVAYLRKSVVSTINDWQDAIEREVQTYAHLKQMEDALKAKILELEQSLKIQKEAIDK